jgi:hypothetical protein
MTPRIPILILMPDEFCLLFVLVHGPAVFATPAPKSDSGDNSLPAFLPPRPPFGTMTPKLRH